MSSIAEYFNPALWRDWFHLGVEQLGYAAFWLAVLRIVFVNFLLSGDNAVVIAMACRELPPQQRRWGLVIGAGVAVILRVILVGVMAWLMLLPYLKLVGGVALIFIAAKLLVPEDPDRDEIQAVAHLWRAVMIIAVADIVMSIDNMVAIAAIAQGNILLLAIGLAVSIPLIVAGAALVHGGVEPLSGPYLGRHGAARLDCRRVDRGRRCAVVTSAGGFRRATCAPDRICRASHRSGARRCRRRAVAVLARKQSGRGGPANRRRIARISGVRRGSLQK